MKNKDKKEIPVKKITEERQRIFRTKIGDMTQKTSKEDLLLFKNLIDQSNDLVFVINPETIRFLYVNNKACNNLGYTYDELSKMGAIDIEGILPDNYSWKEHVKNIQEHIQEQGYMILEGMLKRKNGTTFPVEVNVKIINLQKMNYMVAFVHDITNRKHSEKIFKKEKMYLEKLHNSLGEAVFSVKMPERIIKFANNSIESIFGFRPEECIGRTTDIFYPNKDGYIDFGMKLKEAIEQERDILHTAYLLKRKNGEVFPADITTTFIKNNGEVAEVISIIRDVTDRKQTEDKLRTLSYTVEQNPTSIVIIDTEGRIEYVNSQFTETTGYTSDEAIGKNINMLKSTKHPPEFYNDLWDTIKSGKTWRGDICNKKKNGEFFWELLSIFPVRNTEGEITHFVSVKVDDTERRLSEEILRRSEAGLSKAQRIAHIGNWEWNIVKNELFWSDEIYRIFGLTPQGFGATYETFLNSVHPADREFVKESVNKALNENIPYSIDHRIVLPNGSVRVVHEQAEVVIDNEHKPIQMNGTVQDITERKQIEDQLRKLSHAVEQSTLSIVITDTKGNIEYANPILLDITGYKREEAIGKNPKIFSSGKTPPEIYRDLWNTILSGKDWHGELLNKKKNGELFWEHASISPIKNEDGIITNFVAYKEDITKIKKLEEQFRQAQKMEAVGQLTGGIAHDFNNILTGIILNSELLKLKIEKDNPLRAHVEQTVEQAVKAANLIQSLLVFSRKQTITLQPTDIKDVITSTKRLLSRIIREDIELKIDIPEKDLTIMADEVQIEQVIINLATNARDAMPNGGVLTIEASDMEIDDSFINTHGFGKAGRYALITVTDTGIGMDENIQKKIFEPFFTTKEVGKGTGLGLAMVYGLIKQHEGYIDLYSKPGNGTTFKIYLPIKEQKYDTLKSIEQIIPKGGSETILIAEDDEIIRKTTTNILEDYGYKIIEAIDGDDALEKFVKNKDRIKLVILDVIMPKKSGKKVYNAIQNISANIKVLFMSGYTGDTLQVEEITEKGLNIIPKPFTDKDILKRIREILDG